MRQTLTLPSGSASPASTRVQVDYALALPALATALRFKAGEPTYIPVFTGFLGRGKATGGTTTLGRGGSDLTCTVLGAALGLREVIVWKDVDGVLTSDPRLIKGAKPVNALTYEEATELAYFGAQVRPTKATYTIPYISYI